MAAAFAFPLLLAPQAHSAELGSGTLSLTNRVITLPTKKYTTPNPSGAVAQTCNARLPCDFYTLNVSLPAGHMLANPNDKLRITASWPHRAVNADIDIHLLNTLGVDLSANQGATTADPEIVEIKPSDGNLTYRVRIVPYYVRPDRGEMVSVRMELVDGAPPATGSVSLGGPTFVNYDAPADYRADEPTLDVNQNTNNALMLFSNNVLKAVWDDASPPQVTWTDVTDVTQHPVTADPLMVGDPFKLPDGTYPSRMWVTQLQGATSQIYYSDDEGATWETSFGGGQPHGVDNQSIAAGPYPAGKKPVAGTFPHAVYYCSHGSVNAFCSRSDTGGLTWNTSKPIFPVDGGCSNHGHVKVGADGTVYVPMNNPCLDSEGVAISVDAGQTWTFIKTPNTVEGRWDSSIGIASDGKTLYYGYGEIGDDRPMIIKGTLDKSIANAPTIRWQLPAIDVGAPAGLKNIVFNTVVAGDPNRAAYAFHGTTTEGDSGDPADMIDNGTGEPGDETAVWHLYVATTFDGGNTWKLRDVTPTDPTQKGAICDHGTTCGTEDRPADRNLLDFMDMVIDSKGRLLIGYADGCTGDCAAPTGLPNYDSQGVIARQVGGQRMFAAFDPVVSTLPGKPGLSGERYEASVSLSWSAPDSGSTPITGYVVERAVGSGSFSQIATTVLTKYTDDTAVNPVATYRYRVAARNVSGQGPYSADFIPLRAAVDPCLAPGLTMLTDPAGDILEFPGLTPGLPLPEQIDLIGLSLAQPDDTAGYRFTFTLRVKNLGAAVPPGIVWPVQFAVNGVTGWEVNMTTFPLPTPAFELRKNGVLVPGALVTGNYTAAGEITMTVRASDLGLSSPGTDVLSSFLSRVALADSITPDNMPSDLAPAGRFTSLPPRACAPNAAPVASMTMNTAGGPAPLTVTFNASASSDPDAGDTVGRYVFEFGDGTPALSTTTPIVTHTYSTAGAYGASLRVVDSRGKPSDNVEVGQVVVE